MAASKWGGAFWSDYFERVGATVGYALITLLTTVGLGDLNFDVVWPVLGLPVLLVAIKGLLANLKGTGANGEQPTASLVGVTSNKS